MTGLIVAALVVAVGFLVRVAVLAALGDFQELPLSLEERLRVEAELGG